MNRLGDDELSLKSQSASSIGLLDLKFPVILSGLSRSNMSLAQCSFSPVFFFFLICQNSKS